MFPTYLTYRIAHLSTPIRGASFCSRWQLIQKHITSQCQHAKNKRQWEATHAPVHDTTAICIQKALDRLNIYINFEQNLG